MKMRALAALCIVMPMALQGAGSACGAGQTCSLSADVTLTGSDALSWVGTTASRCRINANGHMVTTSNWGGSLNIKNCDIYDLGSVTAYAFFLSSNNNASVTIQNSIFNHSSSFYVSAIPTIVIQDSTLATKDAVYPSQTFDAGLQAVLYENAGSVVTSKILQRNSILHGGTVFLRGNQWTVDSNIIIGPRASISISGGTRNTITKNYIHAMLPISPNKFQYWADEEGFNLGTTAGAQDLTNVAYDNIIYIGQWVARHLNGDFHDNLVLGIQGHDFLQDIAGKVHNNIFAHRAGGANGLRNGALVFFDSLIGEQLFEVIYASNSTGQFYNNTVDATGLVGAAFGVNAASTFDTVKNNVFYNVNLNAIPHPGHGVIGQNFLENTDGSTASPFNRITNMADYNAFFFAPGMPKKDYSVGVTGKTMCDSGYAGHDLGACPDGGSSDPMFAGSNGSGALPNDFPFSDDEISNGAVTVQQVLDFYRAVYAPRSGSPLIGKADNGGNIGAVQSAPANPFSANRGPVPAFSAYEISSWFPTETTTIAVSDILPLDGHAGDDGQGALSFTWSKVSGPGNVTFTPMSPAFATGPAFAYVTATFSAAGTYVIQLQASDGQATGARQATVYVGTAPAGSGALPTPTGLTATAQSSTQIALSWTPVSDSRVTGYKVYRNGTLTASPATAIYTDSGLTAATAYTYTVASADALGNLSAVSGGVSATTSSATSAPTISSFSVLPTSISAGQSATLSWAVSGSPTPTVSISPTVGTVAAVGTASVSPAAQTTYTLTATSANGSVTGTTTVTINSVTGAAGTGTHPRIWLTPSVLTTIRNKAAANDPDWLAVKAAADQLVAQAMPKYTVTAATNANPVQFTIAEGVPWTGTLPVYISGGAAAWAGVNSTGGDRPNAITATKTGTNTFTIPVDSTAFGPFTGQTLALFFVDNGLSGYGYEGSDWMSNLEALGLAYKVTNNVAYAAKGLDLLNYIASLGAAGMLAPEAIDSGFPSRTTLVAVALGYDWFYDLMTPSQRTAAVLSVNLWYDWFKRAGYENAGPAYSNYFGGHVLGFGLAGYATEAENPRGSEINTYIRGLFDTFVGDSFANGGFAGGYPVESYNYGPNHFIRLLYYMLGIKSATGQDIFASTNYAQKMARNLLYNMKPNRWQVTDEGDFSGDYTGVLNPTFPMVLSSVLAGKTEGAWMQFFYQNMAPAQGQVVDSFARLIFWDPTRTATDYRQTEATWFHSPGDEHLYRRSNWQDDAVWASITGGSTNWAGHQMRSAGHISIQRGSDYLLVNSGQWKGTTGYAGNPQAFDTRNWRGNTLFFSDNGEYNFTGASYVGGQGFWGANAVLASQGSSDFAYMKADLTSSYTIGGYAPYNNRTCRFFIRNFISAGNGIVVVYDRMEFLKSTYTNKLYFHFNPSAGAPVISGNTVTSRVGSSALFMKTLLPATPVLNAATDPVSDGDATPITYRVEVTDSAPALDFNALNVFVATASTVTSMPAANKITSTTNNMLGVSVVDGSTQRVVMFSADGTAQNAVTYTASYPGLTGIHVVADLTPSSSFDVYVNGTKTFSSIASSAQGVLTFQMNGGGTFDIRSTGVTVTAPSCDVNKDGSTNVLDVQLIVNMAIGVAPFVAAADLNADGQITAIDVQRVVNAVLGSGCRIGP